MKKNKGAICTIFIAILFASIIQAQENQHIVSLAPSLTKNIVLLDADVNLVGRTSFCKVPGKDDVPVVASAVDVNLEKVYALKPDLVLVSSLTHPETVEHLKKLDIQVKSFPYPKSYEGLCDQFIEIGRLMDKEEHAREIVARAKQRLDSLKQSIPQVPSPKIFMEIGANPLYAAIPNTFMHDYIVYTNGKNIAHDFTKGSITRETVLVRDPDVIFIVTMGVVGEEEKKTWSGYSNLSATQNDQIHIIDADKSCSPTPVTFVEVVDEMIQLMYANK